MTNPSMMSSKKRNILDSIKLKVNKKNPNEQSQACFTRGAKENQYMRCSFSHTDPLQYGFCIILGRQVVESSVTTAIC